jgi:dimethylaniline monooxygenase (N-oxide forming)
MTRRFTNKIMNCLPIGWIAWYIESSFLNKRFDHKLYGIKPDFGCLSQVPVISDHLPNRLISGRVVVKKNIERFVENGIIFEGE